MADLQQRYALDADDLRELGEKLAHPDRATRKAENEAFAERFTAEHESTFDRLSQ